ncbi:Uncharacterised protein [uncultured archaeon]|nr:Uncharacterised protein [uncultured archaeon]
MEYNKLKIKVFDNWDLFLHENQYPFLGRSYAWARREDARTALDMSRSERDELFEEVIPKWESAIKKLFSNDLSNICSLGNTTTHLHWHLIPRYNNPRSFFGIDFADPNPKGNYSPYPKKDLDESLLFDIRDRINELLS